MKIKCPYCKQSYDLTDADIQAFAGQSLQCEQCSRAFSLQEAMPAVEEYLKLLKCQQRLADARGNVATAKTALKECGKTGTGDYFDEGRFDRAAAEMELDAMRWDLDRLKEDAAEAKQLYQAAKSDLPKIRESKSIYAVQMYDLFERGFLKAPISADDKERILRYIQMGNCTDMLEEITHNKALWYCLTGEYAAICDKLCARYLPMLGHDYTEDGTITDKQAALLVKFGLEAGQVEKISKQDASWLITMILNKDGEALDGWLYEFRHCENKTALLAMIQRFSAAPVVIPPPKD
ncbi:MAG: hypothetical protein J5746_12120 [Victivallales bacterium]|nr:hypothetical protein [Victivallales bacterium]